MPLLLALTFACSSGAGDRPGRLNVVATTTQIGDFARQVGGYNIDLTVILKPNQDAHDFSPKPSQLRAIAGADLVLRNGVKLDAFVNKSLDQGSARAVVVTDAIVLRSSTDEHEGEHADAGQDRDGDPHVWFSAPNAEKMVEAVRDAFVTADPGNAAAYRANADAYLATLEELDRELRRQVETIPPACRKLVTNHDVLGYYAAAYGFELAGSIIPGGSGEARASAANVAAIVDRVRAEQVPAIFAESTINPALVRRVAREAGVKVVDELYGDSLGPKDSEGGTYVGMMRANTEKIVAALRDCPA